MAHLDRDFPTSVASGTVSIIERRGEVVQKSSGLEERNRRWAGSRRRWESGVGIRSADDLAAVQDLFEDAGGKADSFRFQDFGDWKSSTPSQPISPLDQTLGTGDGSTVSFQIVKTYGVGPLRWPRPILLPRIGTVRVAVGGFESPSGWSISPLGGVLTFDSPPAPGAALTVGFTFDAPVRFDTWQLAVDLEFIRPDGSGLAAAPDIPLVEVLSLT